MAHTSIHRWRTLSVGAIAAGARTKFVPVAGATLVDRYQLLYRLGEGGNSIVWAATQLTTRKEVAIKLLKDEASAERALREARIVAHLSHRNIVQMYDYWDGWGGSPVFMVMERLAGETLRQRLERDGRLAHDVVAELALPVVSALEAAHAAGIVHRDLKPDNVFLSHDEVKVLDFGIAKPMTPDVHVTPMTQTGTLVGTPHYMAPEQVYGERDIDASADVWALGVLLYECLVGIPPFTGENYGQIFHAITKEQRVSVRAAVPDVPAALDELLMRMLAHERGARPSLKEVARVLRGGDLMPAHAITQRMITPRAPPRGRGRCAGGVLVAGAFLVFFGWRSPHRPPPETDDAPAPIVHEAPELVVIPRSLPPSPPPRPTKGASERATR